MEKMQNKRDVNVLTAIFMLTYMISYITRINYGAVISEIGSAENITKTLLSMAVTGSFITYGTGQIVSGICGDRFSPKILVSLGLAVTTVMNFLIPFCTSPYLMCAVWCVNGFAQAFMWPPIVKIMSHSMTDADYQTSIVKVLWGSSFGTIAVYLVSPLLISVSSWKAVFFFSSVCGAIMFVLWNILVRDAVNTSAKAETVSADKPAGLSFRVLMTPMILSVLICIVCQGMLRDGVTTWMPSYIAETYNLSNSISILTGVLLPIFSLLCYSAASKLYRKYLKNPLTCSAVIFLAGCVSSFLLYVLSGKSAIASVFLSAVLTGCMHGVNMLLVCMLPAYFKRHGKVSTAAGVLNSFTYIGSALSTYGFASLSENLGWSFTIVMWIGVAALGCAMCLTWSKRFGKEYGDADHIVE